MKNISILTFVIVICSLFSCQQDRFLENSLKDRDEKLDSLLLVCKELSAEKQGLTSPETSSVASIRHSIVYLVYDFYFFRKSLNDCSSKEDYDFYFSSMDSVLNMIEKYLKGIESVGNLRT